MKFLFITTLGLLLLAAASSCQKEVDPLTSRTDSTLITPTGDLLVKTYTKAQVGPDTSVVLYYYNAQKQITALHFLEGPTDTADITYRYFRDNSGLIVRSVQYGGLSDKNDSVIFKFYYSGGTNPLLVNQVSVASPTSAYPSIDSTIYTYDNVGKLIRSDNYYIRIPFTVYMPGRRMFFQYDTNGNTSKIESYGSNGTSYTLEHTEVFTYDTKRTADTSTMAEAIIIDGGFISKNNSVNYADTYPLHPSFNKTATSSYTYNSNNKPATSKSTSVENGVTTNFNTTYHYR